MKTEKYKHAMRKLVELTANGNPVSTSEINRHTRTETTAQTMRTLESEGLAVLCEKYHFKIAIDEVTKKRVLDTKNHDGDVFWADAISYSWLPSEGSPTLKRGASLSVIR